jgi:hypothetical protein
MGFQLGSISSRSFYIWAPDSDVQWRTFTAMLRNQIKKASKSGLQLAAGHLAQLDGFYAVFTRNMRDLKCSKKEALLSERIESKISSCNSYLSTVPLLVTGPMMARNIP